MARGRALPESVQELIRWRWSQRPTLKSLAAEYHVSQSCIKDALTPHLRQRYKRRKEKCTKEDVQPTVIPAVGQHLTRQGRGVGKSRTW